MIQSLIHRLLLRRHFWRHATFSEVAELYASRTMRLFALRLISTFTAIYLYQDGYSLLFIALLFVGFFGYKTLFAWPSVLIVSSIGPKHGTLISNILAAISLLILPFVPIYGIWAIVGWALFQASSTCLYDLCYLIDFSKVKSMRHAGKEIAYMNILEKVATGVAPIIGGFLAYVAGPQVVMFVAVGLFLLAAMPLFQTGEPIPIRKTISFEGFPWRTTYRTIVAQAAVGFDVFTTGTAWVLFITVVVFAGDGNELYAKIGALASVTIVAALVASYGYGKLIDHRRGGALLRFSVLLNSFVHLVRVFVVTPVGVLLTNILNEAGTTGYSMASTRGVFDTADMSGNRVAYLYLVEVAVNLGAALAALALAVLLVMTNDIAGLKLLFILAAGVTAIIASAKFALYRR